jgi:polysaccharide biosynthesis transport protein
MEPTNDPAELELRDYLEVLRRRWVLIAIAVAVVAGVALLASIAQTSRYRAEAEVLVRQPPTAGTLDAATGAITTRSMANEVRQAEGTAVLDATRADIGDEPTLRVRDDADADVLVFTAESSDAEAAATAANRYAEAFVAERREGLVSEYMASGQVLQERAAELDADLDELAQERAAEEAEVPPADPENLFGDRARQAELDRIANEYQRRAAVIEAQRDRYDELLDNLLLSAELAQGTGAQVIRPAEVPEGPFEPTVTRNLALAIVVGLVLGVGAAFLVDHLDTSLRTDDDLEAASGGLPTLANIPEMTSWQPGDKPHVISREQPQSVSAESYRGLRTSVQFLSIDRTINTIAFTSPNPGDGKSTTAANLALVAARAGQRVVLVDCDLRKPRVHEYYGLPNEQGFTTVLLGEASLETAAHRVPDEHGLVVITSGPVPPDPSELLSSKRARSLIESISNQADLVIIDSPPVLAVTDPRIIAGMVDGVILVASAGRTDRNHVTHAVEQLQLVDAPILGTVLNRQDASAATYGYGYSYDDDPATKKVRKEGRASFTARRKRKGAGGAGPVPAEDPGDFTTPDWGELPQEAAEPRR